MECAEWTPEQVRPKDRRPAGYKQQPQPLLAAKHQSGLTTVHSLCSCRPQGPRRAGWVGLWVCWDADSHGFIGARYKTVGLQEAPPTTGGGGFRRRARRSCQTERTVAARGEP